MKKKYTQLTSEERDRIAVLRAAGKNISQIAKVLGRNKSTICRELTRNKSPIYNSYLPTRAHERAVKRKREAGKRPRLKNKATMSYVIKKLRLGWSPEQIAGRLPHEITDHTISHEAIYQFIYDKQTLREMDLRPFLPRRHRKRLPYGHSRKHRKLHIPQRVSIKERPAHINERLEYGHWEVDTMISRQSAASLGVALERLSRRLHLAKLPAQSAKNLRIAVNRRLSQHPQPLRKTITYDNGSENVEHMQINKTLGTQSYFCEPYHSWEKGSVEHALSLIRRFLPKKTNFATITKEQVKHIETLLNNRPRKCLSYKTPNEVFKQAVALAT